VTQLRPDASGARLRRLGFGLEAVTLAWNLIWWTAVTACVMFALAWGKHAVGRRLGNPVLVTEGRVTLIDGVLAVAVLAGLLLDLLLGWWWADPVAALVVVFYACREAVHIFRE
jgi:divalent metal cation (Fe/Co/Zn/Cd) transporter